MEIKFSYKEIPIEPSSAFPQRDSILRPIIPIALMSKNKLVDFEALIDSGADFCIFQGVIGEILGLPVKKGPQEYFSGIQAGEGIAYFHKVELLLNDWRREIYCGFSYDIGPAGYGVLDQSRAHF